MKIKVFGPGCSKCTEAERLMQELVTKLGLDAEIEKISDFPSMMEAGIMSTPAISINNTVKCTGRIPTPSEATAWLRNTEHSADGGCNCADGC